MGSLPTVHHGADPCHPPCRLHVPSGCCCSSCSSRSGELLPTFVPGPGPPISLPRRSHSSDLRLAGLTLASAPWLLGRACSWLQERPAPSQHKRGVYVAKSRQSWVMISDPAGPACFPARGKRVGGSQSSSSGWSCCSPWPENCIEGLLGGNASLPASNVVMKCHSKSQQKQRG